MGVCLQVDVGALPTSGTVSRKLDLSNSTEENEIFSIRFDLSDFVIWYSFLLKNNKGILDVIFFLFKNQ